MFANTNLPVSRNSVLAAAAAIPIVLPAIYIIWLDWRVSKRTRSSSGRWNGHGCQQNFGIKSTHRLPQSIPHEATSDGSDWTVTYERVESHPVPTSALAYQFDSGASPEGTASTAVVSDLLKAYTRAAHVAFSWTPQAFAIRASIKDTQYRRSFDTDQIERLEFENGDIVNGAYRVSAHTATANPASESVELVLEAPPDYEGPTFNGLILSRVESVSTPGGEKKSEEVSDVVFVNETWMWRKPDDKPTLLESKVGAWVHKLLAGWLITKGLEAVTLRS